MQKEKILLVDLLNHISECRLCEQHLPLGPRPVVRINSNAKILVIGQAPGTKVHETGIPWNDPSGDRLRDWMGLSRGIFYNENNIAIMPMGFCYPGRGKSGDLPPRPECAPQWHEQVLEHLPNIELTLLIGDFAQRHYSARVNDFSLKPTKKLEGLEFKNLTDRVRQWKLFRPKVLPLVHPSPRNRRWLKNNPWFEQEVVSYLKRRVKNLLSEK